MSNAVDIINRPINIGDHIVFTNALYVVLDVGQGNPNYYGYGQVKIKLANPSKTTRSQIKSSKDMCLIPKEDYLLYLLKK
jgi:hypothetical protein